MVRLRAKASLRIWVGKFCNSATDIHEHEDVNVHAQTLIYHLQPC